MMYLRYGKVNLKNHFSTLLYVLVAFAMGVGALCCNLFLEVSINIVLKFCILISILILYIFISMLLPYTEKFNIENNVFHIKTLTSHYQIELPNKIILLITEAGVNEATSYQTTVIKNQYAISILRDMPLSIILELLHEKHRPHYGYSNTIFENGYEYSRYFIYSFVLNQELLDKILNCADCLVIIPESNKKVLSDINISAQVLFC